MAESLNGFPLRLIFIIPSLTGLFPNKDLMAILFEITPTTWLQSLSLLQILIIQPLAEIIEAT